jgi:hypothetical protein
MTTAKTVSCAVPSTYAASRAPTYAPTIATAPNTSAVRTRTFPPRQCPTAPTALVVPTTSRLAAIASLASSPIT